MNVGPCCKCRPMRQGALAQRSDRSEARPAAQLGVLLRKSRPQPILMLALISMALLARKQGLAAEPSAEGQVHSRLSRGPEGSGQRYTSCCAEPIEAGRLAALIGGTQRAAYRRNSCTRRIRHSGPMRTLQQPDLALLRDHECLCLPLLLPSCITQHRASDNLLPTAHPPVAAS